MHVRVGCRQRALRLYVALGTALLMLHIALTAEVGAKAPLMPSPTVEQLSLMPLAFTSNDGQWNYRARYRAQSGGVTIWFAEEGVYYHLRRQVNDDGTLELRERHTKELQSQEPHPAGQFEDRVIQATLVGSNPHPRIVAESQMDYKCNWFIGNDPKKWHTDVSSYAALVYKEVYPGIDVRYRGNGKQIEHDFIVSPGADPSLIELRYDGAQSISMDRNGDLIIVTDFGELIERIPKTYQQRNAHLEPVSCCYEITGESSVRFLLDEGHDESVSLVIDPVILVYSTFLGRTSQGQVAVDASGSAYVIGYTNSTDFPIVEPYDGSLNGGGDFTVTKFVPGGDDLVYSTFIGGSDDDYGYAIAVDATGSAYVTGETHSSDWPPVEAFEGTYAGYDACVAKLSPAGDDLIYSTFLGGTQGAELGSSIVVDAAGSAYVCGQTSSSDFPLMEEYDGSLGGVIDVFVTKFTPAGSVLDYSTYLGGSSDDGLDPYTSGPSTWIAIDATGSAYVTGLTESADFPLENEYDGTLGGSVDAFVSKFAPDGSALLFSTYLGGDSTENSVVFGVSGGIDVDDFGSAYVTGNTNSLNFPLQNPYRGLYGGSMSDAFVAKFAPVGDSLEYSSYLGGLGTDMGTDIAVNSAGIAFLTGLTVSPNFFADEPEPGCHNGYFDAFVVELVPSGSSLRFGTFLGGSYNDAGLGIALDGSGAAYVYGLTGSPDFPLQNPYDGTYDGIPNDYSHAFVTKLTVGPCSCLCHGDPDCNGVKVDVVDVVMTVGVAFRNALALCDPGCPAERPDVDCDGYATVVDVVKMVNVAFRNADIAIEFCNPCVTEPPPCSTCN